MINNIELIQGDITTVDCDAIVNAANTSLLGGGGVDGAIHKAAGNELLEECKKLKGCNVGEAKITKGYNLKAKYVIHTVGPIWKDGKYNEDLLLKNSYVNSLQLALKYNITKLAFPNISTGVYKFPKERAAIIATHTVLSFLKDIKADLRVIFVTYDLENFNLYTKLLR